MISLSINVNEIDKARLTHHQNGKIYLNLVLFENRDGPDRFGNDGIVKQGQTKEERDAKKQTPILGNWKRLGGGTAAAKPATNSAPESGEDDVPF